MNCSEFAPPSSAERNAVSADSRARLESREAELVQALYGGPPAPGLDARRVATASQALARKRARAVARSWPALAAALGDEFGERFVAFAKTHPPPDGGPLADGLAFSRSLARRPRLPDEARAERMIVTTQMKLSRGRLVPRRGPRIGAAVVGRPRRLLLVVHLPWRPARLVALPLHR